MLPITHRGGAPAAPTVPTTPEPRPPPPLHTRAWQALCWAVWGASTYADVQASLDDAHQLRQRAQEVETLARNAQTHAETLLREAQSKQQEARTACREADAYLRSAKRRLRDAWCAPSRIPLDGPQLNVIRALSPWGVRADQLNALDASLEDPISHLLDDLFDLAEAAGIDTRKLVRRARAKAPCADINLEIKHDYWKYIDPHSDVSLDL